MPQILRLKNSLRLMQGTGNKVKQNTKSVVRSGHIKKKGEATHGITLIRELFHHLVLPELHPKIHNKVWYFICTSGHIINSFKFQI